MKSCCLLIIWPQFCSRARWRSSFDSWARALAKLAVTNEFSSFALARRITNWDVMLLRLSNQWFSARLKMPQSCTKPLILRYLFWKKNNCELNNICFRLQPCRLLSREIAPCLQHLEVLLTTDIHLDQEQWGWLIGQVTWGHYWDYHLTGLVLTHWGQNTMDTIWRWHFLVYFLSKCQPDPQEQTLSQISIKILICILIQIWLSICS